MPFTLLELWRWVRMAPDADIVQFGVNALAKGWDDAAELCGYVLRLRLDAARL